MIKWSIYQDDITIIGINASNNKATKCMKQYLIKSNREIDNSTIIIGGSAGERWFLPAFLSGRKLPLQPLP